MNILTIWQKQMKQITKKDIRSMLLLSYKRLLQCIVSYAYVVLPLLVLAVTISAPNTMYSWSLFSFSAVLLSQMTALLLRPSMYKKDIHYLVRICKRHYGNLLIIPFFSLIIPVIAVPLLITLVVFFQLVVADGRVRLISLFRTIRAALLLFWYNLPAVLLSVVPVTGMLWVVLLLPLKSSPLSLFWAHILFFGGFYLVFMLFVVFLVVVYTTSVYEHEEELF